MGNINVFIFLLTAPGLGQGQGHDQGLILPLTTGRRNINEAISTVVISGDTIVAYGGHSTSEAEDAAAFNGDATSVGAEAIIIRTSDPTGRITSRTLTETSKTISSTSKTIHKDGLRISRAAPEAPLVTPLSTRIDPPRHYPGTPGIRRPPRTTPPPKLGKTGRRIIKTPMMWRRNLWPPRWSRRKEVEVERQRRWWLSWQQTQKKKLAVGKQRGTGRAAQTAAAAVKSKAALWPALLPALVRTTNSAPSQTPLPN